MKEQTAIKLFSITAVVFMMVCALGVIVSESEEADAASVYTITFDAPGGDGINHAEYKFESGTTIQLPVTTFSRTDHMIEFWEDSDGTRFTPGQDWTITRNDTLTAIYKATNGNHASNQDAIVELGGRYEKNMDTVSSETPGGGTLHVEQTTNLADTEVINGANHFVLNATSPGISYIEYSKAILGINPTHYWFQIRVPSSFDTDPLVNSISINGDDEANVGQTLTYTATVSPSDAANKAVTWRIASGSATITSQDDDSCTVRFSGKGTVVLEASSDDASATTASISIAVTQPVTSITISGSSSGKVGDTITLTATASPSTANNRHVTWSITSGSTRATIVSQTDTTTGGRCTIELESIGSITVRATADDGFGEYATKRITIEDPTNSFTLAFNANGGSGAPSSQSGTSTSSTYSFTIPATVPTRNGYNFDGWATSSGGSAQYQPGGRITVDPGTTTLYAVWSLIEYTCYLNFSAPGASNVPSGLSYTGTSTSSHTFTIPSQTPTMSGQIFKGWATSSGGTAQYQPGQTISVGYNSTKTLYAVWESAQLEITSTQGNTTLTVGDGFTYTVESSVSGCTVSVTGADWLIVTGDVVSGTPTAPGNFDVTVTISKAGYTSDSQSFTLTVVSALGFTSVPTNGLVIVEV